LPSLLTAAEPERRTGKPAAFGRAAMPRERLPNGRKQVQFGPLRSFPAEALRLSSLPGLFRSPPRCSASAPSRSFAGGQSDRIPAALGLMLARLSCYPLAFLTDLRDHQRGPGLLTAVAGTGVLGNQISLLTGHPAIAAALWLGAFALWAIIIYCLFAAGTVGAATRPLAAALDGHWLLATVATEALALAGWSCVINFNTGQWCSLSVCTPPQLGPSYRRSGPSS